MFALLRSSPPTSTSSPIGAVQQAISVASLVSAVRFHIWAAVWEWNGYIILEKDPGDLKGLYLAYKSAVLLLLLALVAYFS